MDDDEYMASFQSCLDFVQRNEKPQVFNAIRANILRRKQSLRTEYENFFTALVNERCEVLSPEEATAQREKYFGAAGSARFGFTG